MANFTLERATRIYEKYVRAYQLEEQSGTELAAMDSFRNIQAFLNNPDNDVYKTMTDEQIVSVLIEDNKKIAYDAAAPVRMLINLTSSEDLQQWELKVSNMTDGPEKDKQLEVIQDLKNVANAFETMKEKMINDPDYRKAVADAIWDMTQNWRLVHLIYSPQDAESGELESGIVSGLFSSK